MKTLSHSQLALNLQVVWVQVLFMVFFSQLRVLNIYTGIIFILHQAVKGSQFHPHLNITEMAMCETCEPWSFILISTYIYMVNILLRTHILKFVNFNIQQVLRKSVTWMTAFLANGSHGAISMDPTYEYLPVWLFAITLLHGEPNCCRNCLMGDLFPGCIYIYHKINHYTYQDKFYPFYTLYIIHSGPLPSNLNKHLS